MTIPSTSSVRRRVAVGATFMVLLRLAFRVIGLVNTLILVRLLSPGDFGVVGLATMAYSAFDLLTDLSFQLAIIRMTDPRRIHYDTAWTMGVMRGVVIAFLIVASSPLIANFVGEPRVIQLSYVLAGLAVILGFENIALVDFQRGLQYHKIFWLQVAGKVAGVAITIPAAYLLRNYWALICGIAAQRLAVFLLGYTMKPYLPRFCVAGWHDLFSFSKWLMITNVLAVIDTYFLNLTIGRIAGTSAIGRFQVAYQIGSLPATEIAAPVRDPIYAGYSRIADNLDLLRRHFLSNFSLLVAVIAPMSLGICVVAEPLTALFLGQKWMGAVQLVRLSALYSLFDAIGHSAGAIYMTMHRQRRFVELNFIVVVAIRLPCIVVGAYLDGVEGAIGALVVTAALNMFLWNGSIPAELGIKGRDFWAASWRTLLACSVMIAAVISLLNLWLPPSDTLPALVRFFGICLIGSIVHVIVQFTAWHMSGSPQTAEAEIMHLAHLLCQRAALMFRGESASSA